MATETKVTANVKAPAAQAVPIKAPDQGVVDKALAKQARDAELNRREQAALEAQNKIDLDRGYRRIEWHPGVWLWQDIRTGHTTQDEGEMIRHVNEERVRLFETNRG